MKGWYALSILLNQARQMPGTLRRRRALRPVWCWSVTRLRVFVDDAVGAGFATLSSGLRAGGVGLEEIAQVAPTIEDLFVFQAPWTARKAGA